MGPSLLEKDFDPYHYQYSREAKLNEDYAEAKRQCETEFFKCQEMKVTAVRFSLVIGPDDYTGRFNFHLTRVKQGLPIYFPNHEARHCFISSDLAADALYFLGDGPSGPINVANPQPLSMSELVQEMGKISGRTPVFADRLAQDNASPYGIPEDWYMNTDKLKALGHMIPEIKIWLPKTIAASLKT